LSPQELYHRLLKKGWRVGLTSIYRSLELFESLGVAFKITTAPSSVNLNVAENNDPIDHPHPTLPPLRGRARVGGGLHLR